MLYISKPNRNYEPEFKQNVVRLVLEEGIPGYRMMQIFPARRKIKLSRTTVLKYMKELYPFVDKK